MSNIYKLLMAGAELTRNWTEERAKFAEFCKPYWMERGGIGFVNHMVTQYINNDEQSIVEYLYNLDEENKQLVIKSSLCTLFAHYLTAKGEDVAVIDADIQRTIARQRTRDKESRPDDKLPWEVYSIFDYNDKGEIEKLLPVLKEQDGWILVDCPGNMEVERLIPVFQAADSVVIPTTYGDNDLDATVELFVPVLRQINETAKLIFAPNRINESKAQFKEEAKRNRDKAWNKVHTYGSLVARIKDSIVFDNSRFNTIDPLNHWQANGVMHCFDEIYKELK